MIEAVEKATPEQIAEELCEDIGCKSNAFEDVRLSSRYPLIVHRCILGWEGTKIAKWLCEEDEIFQGKKLDTVTRKINRLKRFLAEKGKLTGMPNSVIDLITSRFNYLGSNVLAEKEKLLIVQKYRMEKALVAESQSGEPLKATQAEIETYNRMLDSMIDLRKGLGLGIDRDQERVLPQSDNPSLWLLWFLKNDFLRPEVVETLEGYVTDQEKLKTDLGLPKTKVNLDKPPVPTSQN